MLEHQPRKPKNILNTAVLTLALLVGAIVWWLYASPLFVFTKESYGVHWPHASLLLIHVLGGTIALFVGLSALWMGLRNRQMKWHRVLGRVYFIGGGLGVVAGMVLSVLAPREPRSLYVSTFVLGILWLSTALMAFRAIRIRRIEQHKAWMIRSYVVTFTFVLCRLAMQFPLFSELGNEGITATVWTSWTVPVLATEFALGWRGTDEQSDARADWQGLLDERGEIPPG